MPILDFKGKNFVFSHHLTIPFRQLNLDKNKSLNIKKNNTNKIIHGDNLNSLKALLPNYAGKIKAIYIDPPYNTGNEGWCYNDNVNSPLIREWLKENANPVDREDLERHDKWLCMMYPRLKLLHELLSDDGAIFISIDDNEACNLKSLMDEIFGEYNFVSQVAVQLNPRGRTLDKFLAKTHEYILIYAKDINTSCLYEVDKEGDGISDYKYEDKIGKYRTLELRNRNPVFNKSNRPNLFYPFYTNKDFTKISIEKKKDLEIEIIPQNSKGIDGCWTWGKEKSKNNIENLIPHKANTGKLTVFRKDYLFKENKVATTKEKALWMDKNINNENGKEILTEIFEGKCPFDFPKSVDLIKKCLKISTRPDQNHIILDSFAGSGTTAHSVLELNKSDNGNRKFILIEMEKYADEITAERVRKLSKGIKNSKNSNLQKGFNTGFEYYELKDEIKIDSLLEGKNLPDYISLAKYIYYTTTGKSILDIEKKQNYFFAENNDYSFYLIYEPDIKFLRSNESALNEKKLEIINKDKNKKKIVFATSKFMSQKELSKNNITFCQLPYSMYTKIIK